MNGGSVIARESLHAVLLDVDVPSSPHRSGGLLPMDPNLPVVSAAVYDRVFSTALNGGAGFRRSYQRANPSLPTVWII